jgi:hypothetical protein
MMPPALAFRKPPMNGARRIACPHRDARLGWSVLFWKRSANLEQAFEPAGAGKKMQVAGRQVGRALISFARILLNGCSEFSSGSPGTFVETRGLFLA